jgi:uncharacterized protein YbjT (DUF2867 family)
MEFKKILIVGGTGVLGQEIVQQLLKKQFLVFILTRYPEKAMALQTAGAVLLKGDLTDKASLRAACEGKTAILAVAHGLMGRGKYASEKIDKIGQRDLIDVAVQTGISYFSFMSVVGASPTHAIDFWCDKWAIEQYLEQSGLTYNIIRSTSFMELHVGAFLGKSILSQNKVILFGKGANLTNFVSVKNVSQLIIGCMKNPAYHNQRFEIGGLDNLSRLEIVAQYAQKSEKWVKITHVPNLVLRVLSKIIQPFHGGLSRVMAISELFDRTEQTFDVRPLLQIFPMEMIRIQDFIHK